MKYESMNMSGSAQMQSGNLLNMSYQKPDIQPPVLSIHGQQYSFGNGMMDKNDGMNSKPTSGSQIFQNHQFMSQSLQNSYTKNEEMVTSLQYPIRQYENQPYRHPVNMTQSMYAHNSNMTFTPLQEPLFLQNQKRDNSVEQIDDLFESIRSALDKSGEVSQEHIDDLEEQKSNSYKGSNDNDDTGEKNDIYKENQIVTSQQMYNSLNKTSKMKSPFSSEMKSSNSGPISQPQMSQQQNQQQQQQQQQAQNPVMTSSFQPQNKELNHSNSSIYSNNSTSQSPFTGLKKLDKLLGNAQGLDCLNDEEYPQSDDESIIPYQRNQVESHQGNMESSMKTSLQTPKFPQQGNYQMNLQNSLQQVNVGANQYMTSSGQMHKNLMIPQYLQNQNINSSQSANILNQVNQGQPLQMSQQANSNILFSQFHQNSPIYQQPMQSNSYGMPIRQNQQMIQHPMNPNYAQSCILMNQQTQQNMLLLQNDAQINQQQQQQYNDNQNASYNVNMRPSYHSMSSQVPNSGKLMEEHMGTFNGSTYRKQGFLEDSKPSQVIYVNHLTNSNINVNHLYNVFSNFGDIAKIIIKRQKSTAFIEFTQQENATKAKEYMDKKIFFDNEIRVFYSHYETLLNQEAKNQDQFIGTEQTNRFQKDNKMTLNPPSLVLHISSLKQEVCDHEKMHEIFSIYGKIEAIHIEKVPPRYMCHIKFSALKDSLMAVAHMHNKDVKGRKMLISFTRKKLDTSTKNVVTYSKNLQSSYPQKFENC